MTETPSLSHPGPPPSLLEALILSRRLDSSEANGPNSKQLQTSGMAGL